MIDTIQNTLRNVPPYCLFLLGFGSVGFYCLSAALSLLAKVQG
jgi:hypothetical protein